MGHLYFFICPIYTYPSASLQDYVILSSTEFDTVPGEQQTVAALRRVGNGLLGQPTLGFDIGIDCLNPGGKSAAGPVELTFPKGTNLVIAGRKLEPTRKGITAHLGHNETTTLNPARFDEKGVVYEVYVHPSSPSASSNDLTAEVNARCMFR